MPTVYDVTIDAAEKEKTFRIKWHNVETKTEDFFEQSAGEIMQDETGRLRQNPLDIGRKLYHFLDGPNRYLQRALAEAAQHHESLILHLFTCSEAADWPFELLAREDTFLLPHQLHLVRCISRRGEKKDIPAEDRPLKFLFMACSPRDIKPELDFEREEEAIFKIMENQAIDMEVEDSGSLDGLRRQLEQTQYDVVHLSGHTDIDPDRNPYIAMEDESGYRHDVYPDQLWDGALIENPPRLLFLSGCRSGEAPETGAAVSFARMLVERLKVEEHNIPAILGLGRLVADDQAIHAEKTLYRQLSLGKTILRAIQRARYELEKEDEFKSYPAWPLIRLFSDGMRLDGIVTPGQRQRLQPRRMKHVFLENSRVRVLAKGFVGRRRQLQHSLDALKQNSKKVGVLLLGTGGLGKSCLAGKICERFTGHTLIIVHGKFNAITLESALKDAFIQAQDEKGQQILSQKKEMDDKLANLCATSFKEKNYLLLLDDFEQNLEGADKGQPGALLMEAVKLVKALLHYLPSSGKMTQLIFTCRYEFSLTEQGSDLVTERLEKVWLTGFQESERHKKARELTHIFDYPDQLLVPQLLSAGHGNPGLMDELNQLVEQLKGADVSQLLKSINVKQLDFIREHGIGKLLDRCGKALGLFLQWFSIYRQPVGIDGVRRVGEKAGLDGWDELLRKGMGLSLIEYDEARQTYQLTPLLREELLSKLKDTPSCHKAAFVYYKGVCEEQDYIDPILIEEWIFHALGCGEEDVASELGGRLISHLRKCLNFTESRRVGEWILAEKKPECHTKDDAYLLNELAITINEIGDQPKAIRYFHQVLGIWKKAYGEKHQNVGAVLNNLGDAWRATNDPRKALQYYQEAYEIWKNVYGEMHPYIATALNNLGEAYRALGEPWKALRYYQEALKISQDVHGETHPQIAAALNNLGLVWADLGDNRSAVEHCRQALDILKGIYGKRHPRIATALNNVGSALKTLGDHHGAVEYFEQALGILKGVYGEAHPQIAAALSNLGSVWTDFGDPHKAIQLHQRALDILKDFYGETHPQVATTLNNLGKAWVDLGDPHKAIPYYRQAIDIDAAAFGWEHPKLAIRLSNLGEALNKLGNHRSGIEYYRQALDIDEAVFGRAHPKVAIRLNNLGEAYLGLNKKQTAKGYFEQAYVIFKESLGEEHPYTVTAKKGLGDCAAK